MGVRMVGNATILILSMGGKEGRKGYDETTLHLANNNTFRGIRTCIEWLGYHIATDKNKRQHTIELESRRREVFIP